MSTRNHEKYKFIGVLQGRYYNREGRRTRQWVQAKTKIDNAEKEIAEREAENKKLPPCNSRWSSEQGTTLWCEDSMISGVVVESPLVPRQMDRNGQVECVCVEWNKAKASPELFSTYNGCVGGDQHCQYK
jgi:hypothetical protein